MNTDAMVGRQTPGRIDERARLVLLEQERLLRYPRYFGAKEALELGCTIAEIAKDYERGVTAVITRESDGMTLFEWSSDDKAPRNAMFAAGKRTAAAICGHASLMCYVEHELTGAYDGLYRLIGRAESNPSIPHRNGDVIPSVCPVGGAFPLRVDNDWIATLSISGLHDGLDHELCVRSLAQALGLAYGAEVPAYSFQAI